jgi:hypothetical protein
VYTRRRWDEVLVIVPIVSLMLDLLFLLTSNLYTRTPSTAEYISDMIPLFTPHIFFDHS